MAEVKITVDVDGVLYDIADCTWAFVSSCGCVHGVMVSRDYDNEGWYTTEAEVLADSNPNRAVREQDKAAGERAVLLPHSVAVSRMREGCTHTPRYGRPQPPKGFAWGLAARAKTAHIVPELSPEEEKTYYHGYEREPVCGAATKRFEVHPSALHDGVMCKACLTVTAPAQPEPQIEGQGALL